MMNRTKFLISWKVQSIRGDRHKTSKQVNKPIMTECKESHKINIQKGRSRVNEVTPSLDRVVSRVCKGPGHLQGQVRREKSKKK